MSGQGKEKTLLSAGGYLFPGRRCREGEVTSLRKFRKLVIGGIESKIVLLIIVALLLLAGVFLAVTQTQNKLLIQLSGETNDRQLAAMSGTTAGVIDTVITQNMDSITDKEAQLADEMFRDVAARVQMVVTRRSCWKAWTRRRARPGTGRTHRKTGNCLPRCCLPKAWMRQPWKTGWASSRTWAI